MSVPTGATGFSWVKSCHDWVAKFEEIVIFGDCEKNTVTLVDGFVKHFGDKKIRVVQIADYLGEKDANDILRKYGKEAIIKCVNNASELMTQNVKRLSEVESVDLEAQEKIKTGIYSVDKVIGGLYLGMVTLLTGRRGDGKCDLSCEDGQHKDGDKGVYRARVRLRPFPDLRRDTPDVSSCGVVSADGARGYNGVP